MSEHQESEETLLPDDADRKIEELMAALKESEREMMGDEAPEKEEPKDDTPEQATADEEADPGDEFLDDDDEEDFVDLDAPQLDNSADKLELDESDAVEDELLDQLTASVTPSDDELESQAALEALSSAGAEQQAVEANELARVRLDELEEKLAVVEARPLSANVSAANSPSGKLATILAVLAVVLSGTAIWLNLNVPPAQAVAAVASPNGGNNQELHGLKGDLAALRERLAAVEKQAEMGSDEAAATLDRMQGMLARMERRIIERATVAEESVAASKVDSKPVVALPEPQPPVVDVEPAGPVEPQTVETQSPVGKVFIKGWAVNLRSFYHRKDAERLMQRYRKDGIDAEVREIPKGEVTWHRVRVMGFDSKQAADAFISGLSVEQGRDMAWPSRYAGYIDG